MTAQFGQQQQPSSRDASERGDKTGGVKVSL